jgi:hypothetical protein
MLLVEWPKSHSKLSYCISHYSLERPTLTSPDTLVAGMSMGHKLVNRKSVEVSWGLVGKLCFLGINDRYDWNHPVLSFWFN